MSRKYTPENKVRLAGMTDDELLAHMREKHGNPYMPLSMAKSMRKFEFKWWHMGAAAEDRKEQERREAERRLREKLWPTTRPVARPTKNTGRLEIAERYRKSSMP